MEIYSLEAAVEEIEKQEQQIKELKNKIDDLFVLVNEINDKKKDC